MRSSPMRSRRALASYCFLSPHSHSTRIFKTNSDSHQASFLGIALFTVFAMGIAVPTRLPLSGRKAPSAPLLAPWVLAEVDPRTVGRFLRGAQFVAHAWSPSWRSRLGRQPRAKPTLIVAPARASCSRRCLQSSRSVRMVASLSPSCHASAAANSSTASLPSSISDCRWGADMASPSPVGTGVFHSSVFRLAAASPWNVLIMFSCLVRDSTPRFREAVNEVGKGLLRMTPSVSTGPRARVLYQPCYTKGSPFLKISMKARLDPLGSGSSAMQQRPRMGNVPLR